MRRAYRPCPPGSVHPVRFGRRVRIGGCVGITPERIAPVKRRRRSRGTSCAPVRGHRRGASPVADGFRAPRTPRRPER